MDFFFRLRDREPNSIPPPAPDQSALGCSLSPLIDSSCWGIFVVESILSEGFPSDRSGSSWEEMRIEELPGDSAGGGGGGGAGELQLRREDGGADGCELKLRGEDGVVAAAGEEEKGEGAGRVIAQAALDAKRAAVGVGARMLFYPTLVYNVVRNQCESHFHWWDQVDEVGTFSSLMISVVLI